MSRPFLHYFRIVSAVHFGVILTIALFSGCMGVLKKKEEKAIAVKFMVAVPPSGNAVHVKETQTQPDPVDNKKTPQPSPPVEKKKLKSVNDIDISQKKVVRKTDDKKVKEYLSDEEIKKLLLQGAEAGDQNILPSEEARCLSRVKKVLYDAWVQPGADEAGGVVAEVRIRLLLDGMIVERVLVKKSGNSILDDSVMRAVNSVSRITGLTPAFIEEYSSITVSFKVE